MLDASLAFEANFEKIRTHYLQLLPVKIGVLVFIWAYCHHFCAGIRFLLLDLNRGIELRQARASSVIVLIVSLALTAVFGARLW
jgi:succinate dehydrogenase / fumarate reductase cytochrome b subunit